MTNNTYTPKVGDTVTSTLLVGEWEVLAEPRLNDVVGWFTLKETGGDRLVKAWGDQLTRVPLKRPEPPVGSVVFVDGSPVFRTSYLVDKPWGSLPRMKGWLYYFYYSWSEIADRAVPAVNPADDESIRAEGLCRVDDVGDWLLVRGFSRWLIGQFHEKFGAGDRP